MSRPPLPWKKGKSQDYTAFQLVVNVCQDEQGNVWSEHDFLSDEDQELARGLSQGGVPQIAHALLTEAVRRETFMCALIMQSKDPEFFQGWVKGTGEEKVAHEEQLGGYAQHVITRTLEKMGHRAAAGILAMMDAASLGSDKARSE